MVVGTTAAILGSAAIGAAASGLSSSKSSKAAAKATDAQVQANRDSLALQREVYDSNKGILNPFVNQGYAANNALAGLLGIGGTPGDKAAYQGAFDNYRKSTGYEFRVGEGMDALNSKLAASGTLNSGAAQKAALQYGQNIASDEFGRYTSALTGQQQIGVGAGSALAGVGTNFANNATNINSNTADAIGNGALAQAASSNNFMNGISGVAGNAIGALSSYGSLGGGALGAGLAGTPIGGRLPNGFLNFKGF
jgi:hypothetical protein